MCKNESCYEKSLKTGKLCFPAFSSDNISRNMKNYFLIFVGLWIIMLFEPAISMLPKTKLFCVNFGFSIKTKNIIIWIYSRFVFLILFAIPTLYLTINGASKNNFCLMNVNEEICKNIRTELECEKMEKTDFSAFIEINGKAACTFTTDWDYYISQYDRGIDGNSPNNIVLINAVFPEYKFKMDSWKNDQNWTTSLEWINSTKLGLKYPKFEKIAKNRKWEQGNKTTVIIFTTTTNLKLEFRSTLSKLTKKDELNNYSSLMILPVSQSAANIINFPKITGKIKIIHFSRKTHIF